ncbi:hypothetical protein [Paenibacillus farraposensis]|uniref:hypothetical protein n=1 Tax=Paenibacillus farraposensis TaxID=2807095 RepID=UPI001E35BC23|nr:hypothetical protein [Paenibacillus farraposensis]
MPLPIQPYFICLFFHFYIRLLFHGIVDKPQGIQHMGSTKKPILIAVLATSTGFQLTSYDVTDDTTE